MTHDLDVVLNGEPSAAGTLAVLRVQGDDAASFLQGQLTQDVLLMQSHELRLAAWCSAKGRMLASFWLCKAAPNDFLLVCSQDIAHAVIKRLTLFVLRAKCRVSDASQDFMLHGLAGASAAKAIKNIALDAMPMRAVISKDSKILMRLPDAHCDGQAVPRTMLLTPATHAEPAPPTLPGALAHWQWLEVMTGIATITQPVQEAFVPQMINYESVDGVNFKKGCYPGQEVVARSQFRGAIKRRGFLVSSSAPLVAGQEIFDLRDADQPCGLVAQAASWHGLHRAVVCLQTSAQDAPALRAGEAAIALLPLPYIIKDDI